MMSELTSQMNAFEVMLCTVEASKRSKADQNIIELTRFVRDLSRRVDNLVDAEETTR